MRTPTTRFQQLIARLQSGHPEIRNLDVALGVQQQVLGLEIPMTNVEAVAIVYASYDLLKVSRGLIGWQTAL